jgi:hypothetical protein
MMPTCKKEIEMGGHWMHYHPKGVNKGGQRGEGNMYARFQTIWIRGSCVAENFLQWVTPISSQVGKTVVLVTLNPPMLIRQSTSWCKILSQARQNIVLLYSFYRLKIDTLWSLK